MRYNAWLMWKWLMIHRFSVKQKDIYWDQIKTDMNEDKDPGPITNRQEYIHQIQNPVLQYWMMSTKWSCVEQFVIIQTIATGKRAVIYLATPKVRLFPIVLKVICNEQDGAIKSEELLLTLPEHPNIIKMYANFVDARYTYFVYEWSPDGDLYEYLLQLYYEDMSPIMMITMINDVVQAVAHCHRNGIIHRDIKAENFVMCNGRLKLLDFGLATTEQLCEYACGTVEYMAPELIRFNVLYDNKVDIWACGILVTEILSKFYTDHLISPFYPADDYDLEKKIKQSIINDPPNIPWSHLGILETDFIKGLLAKDFRKRFTTDKMVNHPYIKSIHDILDGQMQY